MQEVPRQPSNATIMMPSSRILIPLDVDSADRAVTLAAALSGDVAGMKVGLELINSAGFAVFDRLAAEIPGRCDVFYDCKLHDIPNTVQGASRAIGRRGLWMFNVHAAGGSAMLRAAVDGAAQGAESAGLERKPLVIAVTVLTSISADILAGELGVARSVEQQVVALARLAQDAGCDGVVASPQEIAAIRAACGPSFLIVTPGVRPAGSDLGDQRRVMTPADAARAGADYLVIGRPITGSPDPVAAARAINAETASARR